MYREIYGECVESIIDLAAYLYRIEGAHEFGQQNKTLSKLREIINSFSKSEIQNMLNGFMHAINFEDYDAYTQIVIVLSLLNETYTQEFIEKNLYLNPFFNDNEIYEIDFVKVNMECRPYKICSGAEKICISCIHDTLKNNIAGNGVRIISTRDVVVGFQFEVDEGSRQILLATRHIRVINNSANISLIIPAGTLLESAHAMGEFSLSRSYNCIFRETLSYKLGHLENFLRAPNQKNNT